MDWSNWATETAPALLEALETRGEAVGQGELCELLGVPNRVLRGAVAVLRQGGHLVVTGEGGGYRLATSRAEVARFTAGLRCQSEALSAVAVQMEAEAERRWGRGR